MKRLFSFVLLLVLSASLTACGITETTDSMDGVLLTDALGNSVRLSPHARVVSCYGSFADCWLLSGGTLVGVTDDAVEQGILTTDSVSLVGTVKNIDLEKIVALNPDYVILSADLAAHLKLQDALRTAKIPHGYFRVDTFADYKDMMQQFCAVNGRQDLYQIHVTDVETRIAALREKIPEKTEKTVLLLRVYSTGMKAKTDDNLAGQILKEFGLSNIADENPSLLEDLSVEKIIQEDPDFIIALAMGEQKAADEFLRQSVENDPAWNGLSAVKNGNYFMLPKDLFHYKPNERWAESYETLAKIIYPEQFG